MRYRLASGFGLPLVNRMTNPHGVGGSLFPGGTKPVKKKPVQLRTYFSRRPADDENLVRELRLDAQLRQPLLGIRAQPAPLPPAALTHHEVPRSDRSDEIMVDIKMYRKSHGKSAQRAGGRRYGSSTRHHVDVVDPPTPPRGGSFLSAE